MNTPFRTTNPADHRSIVVACLSMGAFGAVLGLTYPLLTLLLAERGFSPLFIGTNAAVMGVGIALSTVGISALTARFHAGRVLIACLIACGAIVVAFHFTRGAVSWFVLRIALGYFVNNVFVLLEVWINSVASDRIRGRALSAFTMSLTVGFAIGPLGVALRDIYSALPFVVINCILLGILCMLHRFSSQIDNRVTHPPSGALIRFSRAAPVLVVMVLMFGLFDWTMISVMPVYFVEKGMSANMAAVTVSVIHFGMIISTLPLGIVLDRQSRVKVGACCAGGASLGLVLLPLLSPSGWLIWCVIGLVGASSVGIYITALAILGSRYREGMLMAGSAVFSASYTVAGTMGMLASGAIMQSIGHEALPLGFAVGFFVLMSVMLFPAGRRAA